MADLRQFIYGIEGTGTQTAFADLYVESVFPEMSYSGAITCAWKQAGYTNRYAISGWALEDVRERLEGLYVPHSWAISFGGFLEPLRLPRRPQEKEGPACHMPYNIERNIPARELVLFCPDGHMFKEHQVTNCPCDGKELYRYGS